MRRTVETEAIMTVHHVDASHSALADYALLLAEATGVLLDLASVPEAQRHEEYEALLEVHSEGADLHSGVIVDTSDPYLNSLPAVLRGFFSIVMTLGEDIHRGVTPPVGLDQLQVITTALSGALEGSDDTELVDDRTAAIAQAGSILDRTPWTTPEAPSAMGRLTLTAEAALRSVSGLAAGVAA
jgi:hypothetical protein